MNDPQTPAAAAKTSIELDPIDAAVSAECESLSLQCASALTIAIPDRPGYHCPECGYDLRGLPEHNCPECGLPFTIAQARLAGLEYDPRATDDRRAIRHQSRVKRICIALIGSAFALPLLVNLTWPTGVIMFVHLMVSLPFAIVGVGCWYTASKPSSRGIIVGTTLYVVLLLTLDLLLW